MPRVLVSLRNKIVGQLNPAECNDRLFLVELDDEWPAFSLFPRGTITKVLGERGEKEVRPGAEPSLIDWAAAAVIDRRAGVSQGEYTALLYQYQVLHTEDFGPEIDKWLTRYNDWTIPPEEYSRRRDLRDHLIFTIDPCTRMARHDCCSHSCQRVVVLTPCLLDPATARDLDDALSCERLPNGNYAFGVHIADVTYFVPKYERACVCDSIDSIDSID